MRKQEAESSFEVRGKSEEYGARREEVRGKSEEFRGKREEVRGKSEEGRAKREEERGERSPRSPLLAPRFILLALTSSLLAFPLLALPLFAQPGYTNHAGNVIAGFPVALTATHVSLSEEVRGKSLEGGGKSEEGRGKSEEGSSLQPPRSSLQPPRSSLPAPRSSLYPLSIFPESEQRRIAADFGEPRLPQPVKRAIAGAEKAMARSRKRAEKGLCTKEESEAFCAKSETALKAYLDKQVESGAITPAERKAIGK